MGRGSRASCVTMNTGIPKGGGSPQGSNPTSNIRFPIRTAPVEAYISSTIASSVSVFSSNFQSWSRSPSSPIPLPTRTFGPVMNPSSDIETSDVTFPIAAIPLISARSGPGPSLDPGHEPVQELVPAFGEPSFDIAGGDPSLREREERPSIPPLKADLHQRFDVRSIRPLGGRRVDEAVWPLHGVEDIPLDIGRRGRAEPDDPLATDTEIALGLHDPVGPPGPERAVCIGIGVRVEHDVRGRLEPPLEADVRAHPRRPMRVER